MVSYLVTLASTSVKIQYMVSHLVSLAIGSLIMQVGRGQKGWGAKGIQ